jgi:hypothetical protein
VCLISSTELVRIRAEIDRETEKAVELELEIISKTKEVIAEETKCIQLKCKRRSCVSNAPDCPVISTDGLTPEYADLIDEKKNNIEFLRAKLSEFEEKLAEATTESELLFENESSLIVSIHRIGREIHAEESRLGPLRLTNAHLEGRVKEWDAYIREAETAKSGMEHALSHTTLVLDNHEFRGGGIVDLENSIANVNAEIQAIEKDLEQQLTRLAQDNATYAEEQEAFATELASVHSLYDWRPQKVARERMLAQAKAELQRASAELTKCDRDALVKERRLKVLQPLEKKHAKAAAGKSLDGAGSIDDLIVQLERAGKREAEKTAALDASLERILAQNADMERAIEARKRELHQISQLLQTDVAALKKKIAQARIDASIKEADLVRAIATLSAKCQIKTRGFARYC